MKRIILSLLTIIMISVPAALMAQWRGGYGCWGFDGRNFGFGGWPMIILTLVVIGLFAFFAVRMIRSQGSPLASDPLAILKSRYAKGEINKDQYQEMKKDLQ